MSRLLVECGEALYGPRWQCELARELGVSDRTVRRWIAGAQRVPSGVWLDLLRITQERAAQLDALAPKLRAAE
jgi:DNA-binding transcriptional regulator YdaS (Cro superfamily)